MYCCCIITFRLFQWKWRNISLSRLLCSSHKSQDKTHFLLLFSVQIMRNVSENIYIEKICRKITPKSDRNVCWLWQKIRISKRYIISIRRRRRRALKKMPLFIIYFLVFKMCGYCCCCWHRRISTREILAITSPAHTNNHNHVLHYIFKAHT